MIKHWMICILKSDFEREIKNYKIWSSLKETMKSIKDIEGESSYKVFPLENAESFMLNNITKEHYHFLDKMWDRFINNSDESLNL